MDYVNSLSPAEKEKIKNAKVAVIGCGGTGGYVCELLIRLGVGTLVAVDGDCFCESNLNRQLYCTRETLGSSKARAVFDRAAKLDPSVEVIAVCENITAQNAEKILSGCDVVIDALDSFSARKIVFDACAALGIKMIFGAVGAWRVQVGILPYNSSYLSDVPAPQEYHGESVLPFVPSLCAAIEVAEAVKILTANEAALSGKLLDIDLISGETIEIDL